MEVNEWLESEDIKRLIFEIREKKDKLIPFVGSGVSIPSGLPSWVSLLENLSIKLDSEKREFVNEAIKEKDYLHAGELIKEYMDSATFTDSIIEIFNNFNQEPTDLIKSIINLNPKFILTTNYDKLLENAYLIETKKNALSFNYNYSNLSQADRINQFYIFHVHGSIEKPDEIVLSASDYYNVILNNKNFNQYITSVIRQHYILLIGYSFSDFDLKFILEKIKNATNNNISKIYMITSQLTKYQKTKYKNNISFIEYPKGKREFIYHFLNALSNIEEFKNKSNFFEYPLKYMEDEDIKNKSYNKKIPKLFDLKAKKNMNIEEQSKKHSQEIQTLIDKTIELFSLKAKKYIHKNNRFGVIEEKGIMKIIALVDDFSINDIKFAINEIKNCNIFKNINSFQIVTFNLNEDIELYTQEKVYSYIAYKEYLYKKLKIKNFLCKEIKEFEDRFTLNNNIIKQPFIENQKSHYLENEKNKLNILNEIYNFIDSNETHLAIIGEFGSGKTTLSKYIISKYAKEYLKDKEFPIIPIRIELKYHSDFNTFEELILNWLKKHNIENINFNIFKLLIEEDFILLILDGFDEMAIKLDYSMREARVKMLNSIIENSSKIILFSRPNYFFSTKAEIKELTKLGKALKQDSKILVLEELQETQIREYLKRTGLNENEAMKLIKSTYDLLSLSHKPLLLNMIRETLNELKEKLKKKNNLNSYDIYEEYINKWATQGTIQGKFDKEDLITIAKTLAKIFQKTENDKILIDDFKNEIEKYTKKRFNKEHFNDVIDEAFLKYEDNSYSFSIQSFFEFFVSQLIKENLENFNFTIFDSKEFSKETIRFLSQNLQNKRKFINYLYSHLNNFQNKIQINILATIYYLIEFNENLKNEFKNREYQNINFSILNLDNFSFEYSKLLNCTFNNISLRYANFNNSIIQNCHFNKINLEYTIWNNTKLENSNFFYVNLNYSIFLVEKINKFVKTTFYKSIHKQKKIDDFLTIFSSNSILKIDKLQKLQNLIFRKLHSNWVNSLINLNNDIVVSGSYNKTITIWDIKNFKTIKTLRGHNSVVNSLIKINENIIASSSNDKTIKIWNIKNFKEIKTLNEDYNAINALVKIDENTIACGLDNGSIKIWDIKNFKTIKTLRGHNSIVNSLIKINENTIASSSNDKTIKIWNIKNFREIKTLKKYNNIVNSLVKIDENTIVGGLDNGIINLWDIKNFKEIKTLNEDYNAINALVKIDENVIACGLDNGIINLWDVKNFIKIASLEKHKLGIIELVKLNKNTIISSSYDNSIKVWDISNKKKIIHIELLIDDNYIFLKDILYTRSSGSNNLVKIEYENGSYPIWLQDEINGKTEDEFYEYLLDEAKKLNDEYENIKNGESKTLPEILSPLRESYLKYTYAYNIAKEKNLDTSNIKEEILRQAKILGVEE